MDLEIKILEVILTKDLKDEEISEELKVDIETVKLAKKRLIESGLLKP